METLVIQHAVFFLWLFGLTGGALVFMTMAMLGVIRKKFGEIEVVQGKHTVLLADLDMRMQKQEGEVCHARDVFLSAEVKLDKLSFRLARFQDKLYEIAAENTRSHSDILAGRSKLAERVAALEAKVADAEE